MTQIINCTPHPISIIDNNGETILALPKGEQVPRVQQVVTIMMGMDNVEGANGIVPMTTNVFGEVENLPDPQPDTFFVVSRMVLSACPDRDDLLVPNEIVRDEQGRIIGSRSFAAE